MANMGKEADYWQHLRPGTDGALALAWTNVIIEKKLYDDLYVKKWTNAPFLVCEDIEPSGFPHRPHRRFVLGREDAPAQGKRRQRGRQPL